MVRLHRRWRRGRANDDQLLVAAIVAGLVFVAAATFAVLHPAKAAHETTTRVTTRGDVTTTTLGVQVLGETTSPTVPPSTAPRPRPTATTARPSDLTLFAMFLAGLRAMAPTTTTAAPTTTTTTTATTSAPVTTSTTVSPTTTTTGSHHHHG